MSTVDTLVRPRTPAWVASCRWPPSTAPFPCRCGGVVLRLALENGGARYEVADTSHRDHIVDLDSGKVAKFRSDRVEQLQREIAAELGYEITHPRMGLYCRKKP